MRKIYGVSLEIAAPFAMFARPDTGAVPTSYPVPTWSACKGIFESIARLPQNEAFINPTRVEICRRVGEPGGEVRFQRYSTNYGGPLRKPSQIREESSLQLLATVLADVCYRIHGDTVETTPGIRRGHDPCHRLQYLFDRRIRLGRCHHTPSLGWSEFTPSYWGPFRDGQGGRPRETERDVALTLPAMSSLLYSVFDFPVAGAYGPRFAHQVDVHEGMLIFKEPAKPHAD